VSQTRFFSSGNVQSEAEAQQWWLSVAIRTSNSDKITKYNLKSRKETLSIPEAAAAEWFKLNANQSGFYRVKYSRKYCRHAAFH
jgi:aminopeptidase N